MHTQLARHCASRLQMEVEERFIAQSTMSLYFLWMNIPVESARVLYQNWVPRGVEGVHIALRGSTV